MLLASFHRLLLANGYENVNVRELAAHADVGRSTFYEHFEGKDDLLEHSVASILATIADAATNQTPSDALREMFVHFRGQRELATALLHGSTRALPIRVLARKLECELATIARSSAKLQPIAPLELLATSLAHAQLGSVDAWLASGGCDTTVAARVLREITRASVGAMFESGA